MRPTFKIARKTVKKPGFICDEVWNNLVRHWSSDLIFLQRSVAGTQNRNCDKAKETQWCGGRKPQNKHRQDLAGPEKKKVSMWKLIKHCWTKGDESDAELPPRIAELETKYQAQVEKKRAELGPTDSDLELDES
ncbi:unnamed protein product [Cuscuta epithymum]|uniref:Uncharacterized protein n=1 Tax=Cuscuta epithymum TaxID=186058 RepID=A0AAV0GLL2_9ASTE|nr:unnamed protein product [Cuscuta epithymum]CAH9148873.1 unnamed protein product [Cuscuta epithymum]